MYTIEKENNLLHVSAKSAPREQCVLFLFVVLTATGDRQIIRVNCPAYIDLNAVRAKLVERSEDYRWCSLGYHMQTGNGGDFLSTDFGLAGFGDMSENERFRRDRCYVYETGADERNDGKSKQHIPKDVVQKERDRDYVLSLSEKFLKRTRYFSDSGIIGSKAFVSKNYHKFKHVFQSKHEKKPKSIKGLKGLYSLKRLTT